MHRELHTNYICPAQQKLRMENVPGNSRKKLKGLFPCDPSQYSICSEMKPFNK